MTIHNLIVRRAVDVRQLTHEELLEVVDTLLEHMGMVVTEDDDSFYVEEEID